MRSTRGIHGFRPVPDSQSPLEAKAARSDDSQVSEVASPCMDLLRSYELLRKRKMQDDQTNLLSPISVSSAASVSVPSYLPLGFPSTPSFLSPLASPANAVVSGSQTPETYSNAQRIALPSNRSSVFPSQQQQPQPLFPSALMNAQQGQQNPRVCSPLASDIKAVTTHQEVAGNPQSMRGAASSTNQGNTSTNTVRNMVNPPVTNPEPRSVRTSGVPGWGENIARNSRAVQNPQPADRPRTTNKQTVPTTSAVAGTKRIKTSQDTRKEPTVRPQTDRSVVQGGRQAASVRGTTGTANIRRVAAAKKGKKTPVVQMVVSGTRMPINTSPPRDQPATRAGGNMATVNDTLLQHTTATITAAPQTAMQHPRVTTQLVSGFSSPAASPAGTPSCEQPSFNAGLAAMSPNSRQARLRRLKELRGMLNANNPDRRVTGGSETSDLISILHQAPGLNAPVSQATMDTIQQQQQTIPGTRSQQNAIVLEASSLSNLPAGSPLTPGGCMFSEDSYLQGMNKTTAPWVAAESSYETQMTGEPSYCTQTTQFTSESSMYQAGLPAEQSAYSFKTSSTRVVQDEMKRIKNEKVDIQSSACVHSHGHAHYSDHHRRDQETQTCDLTSDQHVFINKNNNSHRLRNSHVPNSQQDFDSHSIVAAVEEIEKGSSAAPTQHPLTPAQFGNQAYKVTAHNTDRATAQHTSIQVEHSNHPDAPHSQRERSDATASGTSTQHDTTDVNASDRRANLAERIRRFREEPPAPRDKRTLAVPVTGNDEDVQSGGGSHTAISGPAQKGQASCTVLLNQDRSEGTDDDRAVAATDAVAAALLARSHALLRERDAIQTRIQATLDRFRAPSIKSVVAQPLHQQPTKPQSWAMPNSASHTAAANKQVSSATVRSQHHTDLLARTSHEGDFTPAQSAAQAIIASLGLSSTSATRKLGTVTATTTIALQDSTSPAVRVTGMPSHQHLGGSNIGTSSYALSGGSISSRAAPRQSGIVAGRNESNSEAVPSWRQRLKALLQEIEQDIQAAAMVAKYPASAMRYDMDNQKPTPSPEAAPALAGTPDERMNTVSDKCNAAASQQPQSVNSTSSDNSQPRLAHSQHNERPEPSKAATTQDDIRSVDVIIVQPIPQGTTTSEHHSFSEGQHDPQQPDTSSKPTSVTVTASSELSTNADGETKAAKAASPEPLLVATTSISSNSKDTDDLDLILKKLAAKFGLPQAPSIAALLSMSSPDHTKKQTDDVAYSNEHPSPSDPQLPAPVQDSTETSPERNVVANHRNKGVTVDEKAPETVAMADTDVHSRESAVLQNNTETTSEGDVSASQSQQGKGSAADEKPLKTVAVADTDVHSQKSGRHQLFLKPLTVGSENDAILIDSPGEDLSLKSIRPGMAKDKAPPAISPMKTTQLGSADVAVAVLVSNVTVVSSATDVQAVGLPALQEIDGKEGHHQHMSSKSSSTTAAVSTDQQDLRSSPDPSTASVHQLGRHETSPNSEVDSNLRPSASHGSSEASPSRLHAEIGEQFSPPNNVTEGVTSFQSSTEGGGNDALCAVSTQAVQKLSIMTQVMDTDHDCLLTPPDHTSEFPMLRPIRISPVVTPEKLMSHSSNGGYRPSKLDISSCHIQMTHATLNTDEMNEPIPSISPRHVTLTNADNRHVHITDDLSPGSPSQQLKAKETATENSPWELSSRLGYSLSPRSSMGSDRSFMSGTRVAHMLHNTVTAMLFGDSPCSSVATSPTRRSHLSSTTPMQQQQQQLVVSMFAADQAASNTADVNTPRVEGSNAVLPKSQELSGNGSQDISAEAVLTSASIPVSSPVVAEEISSSDSYTAPSCSSANVVDDEFDVPNQEVNDSSCAAIKPDGLQEELSQQLLQPGIETSLPDDSSTRMLATSNGGGNTAFEGIEKSNSRVEEQQSQWNPEDLLQPHIEACLQGSSRAGIHHTDECGGSTSNEMVQHPSNSTEASTTSGLPPASFASDVSNDIDNQACYLPCDQPSEAHDQEAEESDVSLNNTQQGFDGMPEEPTLPIPLPKSQTNSDAVIPSATQDDGRSAAAVILTCDHRQVKLTTSDTNAATTGTEFEAVGDLQSTRLGSRWQDDDMMLNESLESLFTQPTASLGCSPEQQPCQSDVGDVQPNNDEMQGTPTAHANPPANSLFSKSPAFSPTSLQQINGEGAEKDTESLMRQEDLDVGTSVESVGNMFKRIFLEEGESATDSVDATPCAVADQINGPHKPQALEILTTQQQPLPVAANFRDLIVEDARPANTVSLECSQPAAARPTTDSELDPSNGIESDEVQTQVQQVTDQAIVFTAHTAPVLPSCTVTELASDEDATHQHNEPSSPDKGRQLDTIQDLKQQPFSVEAPTEDSRQQLSRGCFNDTAMLHDAVAQHQSTAKPATVGGPEIIGDSDMQTPTVAQAVVALEPEGKHELQSQVEHAVANLQQQLQAIAGRSSSPAQAAAMQHVQALLGQMMDALAPSSQQAQAATVQPTVHLPDVSNDASEEDNVLAASVPRTSTQQSPVLHDPRTHTPCQVIDLTIDQPCSLHMEKDNQSHHTQATLIPIVELPQSSAQLIDHSNSSNTSPLAQTPEIATIAFGQPPSQAVLLERREEQPMAGTRELLTLNDPFQGVQSMQWVTQAELQPGLTTQHTDNTADTNGINNEPSFQADLQASLTHLAALDSAQLSSLVSAEHLLLVVDEQLIDNTTDTPEEATSTLAACPESVNPSASASIHTDAPQPDKHETQSAGVRQQVAEYVADTLHAQGEGQDDVSSHLLGSAGLLPLDVSLMDNDDELVKLLQAKIGTCMEQLRQLQANLV